jgi:hypothetical protein
VQVAREFQTLHWLRLGFNALSALFVFVGFVRFHRDGVLAERATAPREPAAV